MVLTKDWKQEDLQLGSRVKLKDVIDISLLTAYPLVARELVKETMQGKKYTITDIRYGEEDLTKLELIRLVDENSYSFIYNLDLIEGIYI